MDESKEMAKVYDPKSFEKKWYSFWEENKFFHANEQSDKKPYSIVIPPPNVTGQLHMGHALDNTLQDILVRFHRMRGFETLWMPGCDHAGIATQARVEAQLREENTSRHELGREKFLARVWKWKEDYGSRIMHQLRSLGSSLDWDRERFTMDEGCSRAVREVFKRLYDEGLIYRGRRITNWCPKCMTALSDIEVNHETEAGHLWHLRYRVEGTDEFVEIATTRPETMFGDTGVAVHPDDNRYKHLIGKTLILPIVERKIPLFADDYVDPTFGTGAVKVTPAHDPNDFAMGQRHNLEEVKVINDDGTMGEGAGKYVGLDRYECRRKLVEELKATGVLVKTIDHEHAVGHCSRCNTTVEPLVSRQWFVKMESLAKPAIEAVNDGRIKFVPERFTKIYTGWLEEIRDWCISRQLWWGHRIPAWYCDDCGGITVAVDTPAKCTKCGSIHIHQDEDVLDTWFSSGLWPFETMGWPEDTSVLKKFYPTNVLVTGYDIIFFWVARMVMMGLKFTGDVPFRHVFIHGLVRDAQGRKMSKSLRNGIDPLEVIDKYGADTLRFMLITGNTPGNDMRFYWERVEGARNFANKIHNASRFVLMNTEGTDVSFVPESADFTLADRWIMSRAEKTVAAVTDNLVHFELGEAGRAIYEFIWSEYCDWYIEISKKRLYDKTNNRARLTALYVLRYVLERSLRLLHPFMPFITEEIWQKLPNKNGASIMIAPWPEKTAANIDDTAETQMAIVSETVKVIRNLRAEMQIPTGKKCTVILATDDDTAANIVRENITHIETLASAEKAQIISAAAEQPHNTPMGVAGKITVYMPLTGLIDVDKELLRTEKEFTKLQVETAKLDGRLKNEKFLAKAPAEVIESERAKLTSFNEKLAALKAQIDRLQKAKKA